MDTPTVDAANAAIETLRSSIPLLSLRDQRFAGDLVSYFDRKHYVTPGQAPWVGKLIARAGEAVVPTEPQHAVAIGDTTALNAMFDRVRVHLKAPAVIIQVPNVGMVRVFVGKPNNRRYAGKVVVADYDKLWPQAKTYGIINTAGMFEPRRGITTPPTLIPTLTDFALNPIKHAAAYGKLTGRCCFCNSPLEDARSTAQGWGPICAKRWGLPWGDRPAKGDVFLSCEEATPDQSDDLLAGFDTPAEPTDDTQHGEATRVTGHIVFGR